jgi:teichuronic acid biosynthesis glycosyltransferase TuaG
MNDLVSIITPAYNAEKYLKHTIESVISQDYDNWELLIVDDCSKDNSRLMAEGYMERDPRIKLISLEKNSGVAVARNTGIKVAKGRYIAFLDSDDLWHPNKLSKQISFMKKNGYAFTFTGNGVINDSGVKLNKVFKVPKQVNYKRLLRGNLIHCLTVILDKQQITNIQMPRLGHEDYATWLSILKQGHVAYGLNENLALYRKAQNSLSSNKFKTIKWNWKIYHNYLGLGLFRSALNFLLFAIIAISKRIY